MPHTKRPYSRIGFVFVFRFESFNVFQCRPHRTHTHTRSFLPLICWCCRRRRLLFCVLIHSSRPLCTIEMNRFKMQNISMCDQMTLARERDRLCFCFIAVKTNVIISKSILLDTSIKQRRLTKFNQIENKQTNTSAKQLQLWKVINKITNGICWNKTVEP